MTTQEILDVDVSHDRADVVCGEIKPFSSRHFCFALCPCSMCEQMTASFSSGAYSAMLTRDSTIREQPDSPGGAFGYWLSE